MSVVSCLRHFGIVARYERFFSIRQECSVDRRDYEGNFAELVQPVTRQRQNEQERKNVV